MKTLQEIAHAHKVLVERIQEPGLNGTQKTLLIGMLNAIIWVENKDLHLCTTMQGVIDGVPFSKPTDLN